MNKALPMKQDEQDGNTPVLALRITEAAKALGISKRSLEELKARGEVPFTQLGPKLIVYPLGLLDKWLVDGAYMPPKEKAKTQLDKETSRP